MEKSIINSQPNGIDLVESIMESVYNCDKKINILENRYKIQK